MTTHRSSLSSPEFRLRIVAPKTDIDELGHVSNIAYVRWIQEVAVAHSAAVGLPMEHYLERGAVFVVRKHEVEYLRPAFADETIVLSTHVDSFRGAQSLRITTITREADNVVLTRAQSTWVFMNFKTGRPSRIPKDVQEAFYNTQVDDIVDA